MTSTHSPLTSPAPTPEFLDKIASHPHLRPDTWYLIAAATTTALGCPSTWIPAIYHHAVAPLGPAPPAPTPAPIPFLSDPLPRRRLVRRIKESLVKSIILSGVPHAIEGTLALKNALEPGDRDSSFVREGIEFGEEGVRRGWEAIERVYDLPLPIDGEVGEAMRDILWLSPNITYGVFLYPLSPHHPRAPLTFPDTESVVLSCLLAQRAAREVSWHHRGALKSGMTVQEVEAVQQVVEMVAEECCGKDVRTGMPRVGELELELELDRSA